MKTPKNYLKFWGTRGSCAVSGPEYAQFGGNTSCLEVVYEGTTILFDAGTGIRPLGLELLKREEKKHHLFISHTHWDHIIGFPFFDPLYHPGHEVHLWLPEKPKRNGKGVFQELLSDDFFPVRLNEIQAKIHFHQLHPGKVVEEGPLRIEVFPAQHPGPTVCFKITTPRETFCYVTDNEVLPGEHHPVIPESAWRPLEPLLSFLKRCDLCIHEAQYLPEEYAQKAGWGHSSLRNAAALVERLGIERWVACHHDPKHSDETLLFMEQEGKRLLHGRCEVEWVGDNKIIQLQ